MPKSRVAIILLAASLAVPAMAADHFPEDAKDSLPILDEQYKQMDRYFDRQAELSRVSGTLARYYSSRHRKLLCGAR